MKKNQLKRKYHCHFISNNAGDDDQQVNYWRPNFEFFNRPLQHQFFF